MIRSEPAIYAVRMNEHSEQEELERITTWSKLVSVERSLRIARFRLWEDQWRSLAGDRLVQYVLREVYKLQDEQIIITKNKYNKPILLEYGVHFNVSHSGKWVVAAFHTKPIGIDIELIARADMKLAEAMFTSGEYTELCTKLNGERDQLFYAIWTGKESYMKAVGKGLTIPLDSFSVTEAVLNNGIVSISGSEQSIARQDRIRYPWTKSAVREAGEYTTSSYAWCLRQCELDPAYKLTVCSVSSQWSANVQVLHASQL